MTLNNFESQSKSLLDLIWNDRYNKALTDPISWRLAFADCRFFQIL